EKLFWKGDLSQNIELEPDDYLYIANSESNNVYVLGEVTHPGLQAFAPNLGVLGAIAARGGFNRSAFRERVLVVRGSLSSPQLFTLNTNNTLKGRAADFPLKPNDIVFVNARP